MPLFIVTTVETATVRYAVPAASADEIRAALAAGATVEWPLLTDEHDDPEIVRIEEQ